MAELNSRDFTAKDARILEQNFPLSPQEEAQYKGILLQIINHIERRMPLSYITMPVGFEFVGRVKIFLKKNGFTIFFRDKTIFIPKKFMFFPVETWSLEFYYEISWEDYK